MATPNKPPYRFVGGKNKIKKELRPWTLAGTRLISPFLGGGAIELDAHCHDIPVYAADIDAELIHFWKCLISKPKELYELSKKLWPEHPVTQEVWLRHITRWESSNELKRAVHWHIVQSFSFNGLGIRGRHCETPRRSNFPSACERLQHYELNDFEVHFQHWEDTIQEATRNDVIYLDPPYPGIGDKLYLYSEIDWEKFCDTLYDLHYDGRHWILTIIPDPYVDTQLQEFFIAHMSHTHNSNRHHPQATEWIYSNFSPTTDRRLYIP